MNLLPTLSANWNALYSLPKAEEMTRAQMVDGIRYFRRMRYHWPEDRRGWGNRAIRRMASLLGKGPQGIFIPPRVLQAATSRLFGNP